MPWAVYSCGSACTVSWALSGHSNILGELFLQGTNGGDFDLSFFNLQFLYVNFKP